MPALADEFGRLIGPFHDQNSGGQLKGMKAGLKIAARAEPSPDQPQARHIRGLPPSRQCHGGNRNPPASPQKAGKHNFHAYSIPLRMPESHPLCRAKAGIWGGKWDILTIM
jgi:hypothetical protein